MIGIAGTTISVIINFEGKKKKEYLEMVLTAMSPALEQALIMEVYVCMSG